MQTLSRTTGTRSALDGDKLAGRRIESAEDINSGMQMIQAVIDLENRYGSVAKVPSGNPELKAVRQYNHTEHRKAVSLKRQKFMEDWSNADEVIIREYTNSASLHDIGMMLHMGQVRLRERIEYLRQQHRIPRGRRVQMYEVNYKGRVLTGSMRQLKRRLSMAEQSIRAHPLKKLKKAAFESD